MLPLSAMASPLFNTTEPDAPAAAEPVLKATLPLETWLFVEATFT
jgi:hypothetical protein